MFEAKTQISALSGGVFNHRGDALGFIERDINRFGDSRQTALFAHLHQVAAGQSITPEAENAAVIAKMIRVMMLAPFLVLLSFWRSRHLAKAQGTATSKLGNITIPWFALIFIAVAAFNSFNLLPETVIQHLLTLDTIFLSMAMAALGLTTHVSALRQAGLKPLVLASLLFIWLLVGGAGINQLIQHLFA